MTEKQIIEAKARAYRVVNIMEKAYSTYDHRDKNSLLRKCNEGFKLTDNQWNKLNKGE
jgi:hypothetical protein